MAHPYGIVLARNVRAFRARAGLSQESVAARMRALGWPEWNRQTVGATERPRPARRVTAEELLGLALALETSMPRLLAPDDDDAPLELPSGVLAVLPVQQLAAGLNDHSVEWDGDVPVFTPGTRLAPSLAGIVSGVLADSQAADDGPA